MIIFGLIYLLYEQDNNVSYLKNNNIVERVNFDNSLKIKSNMKLINKYLYVDYDSKHENNYQNVKYDKNKNDYKNIIINSYSDVEENYSRNQYVEQKSYFENVSINNVSDANNSKDYNYSYTSVTTNLETPKFMESVILDKHQPNRCPYCGANMQANCHAHASWCPYYCHDDPDPVPIDFDYNVFIYLISLSIIYVSIKKYQLFK
jgi:hypothetical protein